ncbi:MAG: 8-amino-7-oxononanoate synthase [Deltaproteobacteria bacterium]
MADPLQFLDGALQALEAQSLARANVSIDSAQGPTIRRNGRALLNLTSNDYLSLAGDPRLRRAAAEAAERFGAGAGASRLLGGDLPIHRELEAEVAALKGTERAVVFPSGYHVNSGVIPALVEEGDAVFSDELNHASIVDGCRLSRAERSIYRHADVEQLSALLRQSRARRKLVVTDSLFSMDGDVAPLKDICDVAERHGAFVMVDEAHATGLYGGGAGLCAELGVASRVAVQMGTFGKALGSSGAYVAGSSRLAQWLVSRCRSYVFTTALPPPSCGAALAAIRLVRSSEGAVLRERLCSLARAFSSELERAGLGRRSLKGERQLFAILVGAPDAALAASERLEQAGIFVRAVRPPTVPVGGSRLRASVCAGHSEAELRAAARAIGASLLETPSVNEARTGS